MLFNRIFRERALQRRGRQEPLDDLLQITAPHEWLILAGLAVMLVVFIAFGLFGRVDRAVSYEAVLAFPGEHHYLAAPVSGTVTDVLVGEADTVAPGQIIAYVQAFLAQYRESVIVEVIDTPGGSEQLTEGARDELLLTLLAAGWTADPLNEIVSPISGRIVSLDLTAGQPVSAGGPIGLVFLESTGPPKVVAFVSPVDAGRLHAGMSASVTVAGPAGAFDRVFRGKVAEVSPRAKSPPNGC